MKKSELKQLIREVVEEVYSQQDEGVMDFLKNPFGKKTGSTGKKFDPKNIKEIYENNSKAIPDIIEALDHKRHEVKDQLDKLESHGPDWYSRRTPDGYETADSGRSIFNPDHAEQGDAAAKRKFQEKRKQLKQLISSIETTAGYVREFERTQKEFAGARPERFNSVYAKDLNNYIKRISDSLRSYGLDGVSGLLKPFPSA